MKTAETIEREMNDYIQEKFKGVDTKNLTRELQIGPFAAPLDLYNKKDPKDLVDQFVQNVEYEGYINTVILSVSLIPAEEYPYTSDKDFYKGQYVLTGDAIAEECMAAFND